MIFINIDATTMTVSPLVMGNIDERSLQRVEKEGRLAVKQEQTSKEGGTQEEEDLI